MPLRQRPLHRPGWLAPLSRFHGVDGPGEYQEYIVSTCYRGKWNATVTPLCFRRDTCPHRVLSQVLHSASGGSRSCSARLRRAGCVDLPVSKLKKPAERYSQPLSGYRLLCGWLAPRDGCACLPCFTECRRSELCPRSVTSAVAPPLPSGSPNGNFAFVFSLRLPANDLEARATVHASKLAELLRAVVSLVWTKTRHSIVLLSDGVSDSALAPFRRLGVRLLRLAPPPEGLDKAHKKWYTFAKLDAWSLLEYDKVVSFDTDIVVRRNVDHLFSVSTPAAALDPTWGFNALKHHRGGRWSVNEPNFKTSSPAYWPPNASTASGMMPFNSGVVVLTPSRDVYEAMRRAAAFTRSYDGGDQGFLAAFFASRNEAWYELPRRYHLGWCVQPEEAQAAFIWHLFQRTPYQPILALQEEVEGRLREAGLPSGRSFLPTQTSLSLWTEVLGDRRNGTERHGARQRRSHMEQRQARSI